MHIKSISEHASLTQQQPLRSVCDSACKRRGIPLRFESANDKSLETDVMPRHRQLLKYVWWAYDSGERRTAIGYGLRVIAERPSSIESWNLLFCAFFKPFTSNKRSAGE